MINQPTTQRPQQEAEKSNGNTQTAQERFRATEPSMADQAARIGEALEQMKKATSNIYEAVSSLGNASGDIAKLKFAQSKLKAMELESQAENKLAERPLLYVGAAFALGWLFSRLIK